MNDQKLDKIFANKLAKHKVKPSADAWKRIDNQLGGKNDKPVVWWQLMLLGFLFISLSVGAYTIYDKHNVGNVGLVDSNNTIGIELQDFEIQIVEALHLNNNIGINSEESKSVDNQKNNLKEIFQTTDLDGDMTAKNTVSKNTDGSGRKRITQSNKKKVKSNRKEEDGNSDKSDKKNNLEELEIDEKAVPLPEHNTSLYNAEENMLTLKSKKVSLEIEPIKNKSATKDSVKQKRIKVEITIPQSKQDKNNRKGGEQETQGFAIHFKSVLKNVLSN